MPDARPSTLILTPVFDDWESLALLLPRLDATLAEKGVRARLLVVNDGSSWSPQQGWISALSSIVSVDILHLRRNLGHQRAIAVGLVWVHRHVDCDRIVILDSDGEDRPEDVPALLDQFDRGNGARVTFAARIRRSEGLAFRAFYHLYRLVHKLLTGVSVRVGNFSVVPRRALNRLVVSSELWNHFAAAVFHSRSPYQMVPLARGKRLRGESRMNFPSLVVHGLSAISVFSDIVGARLLAVSMMVIVLSVLLIGAVAAIRLTSGLAIPGWATYTSGILLVILSQALMLSFLMVFTIVSARSGAGFLPIRDGEYFIDSVERVWPVA